MAQNCFIGIDQGSSSTKALVFSEAGQVLFQTRRGLPAPFREGERIEYDAGEILSSVQDVLKQCVDALRVSGAAAAGIGLSCQRSSCLVWNEATGEPLSPVLSWRDRRGSGLVEKLGPKADLIFETSGLPLTPYYSASKFRWLVENVPAASTDKAVFGTLSSFLVQRLTGRYRAFIDHSHAARTQLMNIHTLAWDPDLRALFGLDTIRLPEIVPVLHEFGTVQTDAGPLPVRACAGDQQAALVGLGVLDQGDAGINYGTGGFLMVNTGTSLVPVKGMMASIHYSDARSAHYLLEGSVNAAGDSLEWLRSNLRLFKDYDELDDVCWQAATDVVAFIALNGTGAPHWENSIPSANQGMSASSTAADIVRGVVEGIAFFMKDIAEEIGKKGVQMNSPAVSGGLSSLSYLVQVQADILSSELRVSAAQEVSSLGACLLAGMAAGTWSTADVKRLAGGGESVPPRQNTGAMKRYKRWKELHRMSGTLGSME